MGLPLFPTPPIKFGEVNMPKESSEKNDENIRFATIIIENTEIVDRYGSANAEFVKGYSGIDQETQRHFKGLKDISKSKVHPDYAEQNIKQQAGFSAEVNKVSRDNARSIIEGRSKRSIRTDDAPGFAHNDQRFDHVELRGNEVIDGSGSQMKFVGNHKRLLNKIALGEGGGKNDFSRYQGSALDLPSEQVESAKEYCREQSSRLRQKAARLEEKGLKEQAQKCRRQAQNFDELEKNCRDSGMTTEDAVFLRKHPELGTALEMLGVAHEAGKQGAVSGLTAGATFSVGLNLWRLTKGDVELDEVITNIAKDSGKSALMGYAGTAVGSVAKGAMQQSDKALVRAAANTALPGMIASMTVDVAKTLCRLGAGEISPGQVIEELGQKGVNTLAGVWGGTAGQILIPIPVVGAMVGASVACALSSLCFTESIFAIRAARAAKEQYEEICASSRALCRKWEAYRLELYESFEAHFAQIEQESNEALEMMERVSSLEEFEVGAQKLAKTLNVKLRFGSFAEFQEMLKTQ